MARASRLAIHGGEPTVSRPFGQGRKHGLREWQALKPVFERGSIPMTRGPEVMKLREAFSKRFGLKYAVTTSSGTAALHTALAALEIGRGDEVITSPVTDMGTVLAILQLNAVPVFADVDPLTMMITPKTVADRMTRHTRAVVPVHLAGQACDMRGLLRLTRPKGIPIVEDVAQSYMTRQGKRLVGTMGDIGCWSLNESKHIGAGDGGMLLTNNRKLAERADLFADKCYNRSGGPTDPCFAPQNYRLNALTAAVSLEQLKIADRICDKRHRLGTRLDELLGQVEGIIPRPVPKGDYATYWHATFHVDQERLGVDTDTFAEAVQAEGLWVSGVKRFDILSWTLFREQPLDRHACSTHCPYYKGKVDYSPASFPGLAEAFATGLRLPVSEFFTMRDINDMARAVKKVAAYYCSWA